MVKEISVAIIANEKIFRFMLFYSNFPGDWNKGDQPIDSN